MLHTVHELRSRWKPTKIRLNEDDAEHSLPIRLHRSFSWLQRCEECEPGKDPDLTLICHWIAFNALYGQWNIERREPLPDRECWRVFIERLLRLDESKHLATMLTDHRQLVMDTLNDEYLSSFFWQEPTEVRASKSRKAMYDARTWYVQHQWGMILDRVLERIYLLRCQLVHGASTFGGKLNRLSLQRSMEFMQCFIDAVLLAVIDHGADEHWGAMCYPPIGGEA